VLVYLNGNVVVVERCLLQEKRLLLGGALEPLSEQLQGMLVFDSKSSAEQFAAKDPYVIAEKGQNVVETFSITQWNVVVGSMIQ
jgi:hypothetical protein